MRDWGEEIKEVGHNDIPALVGHEYVACQIAEMGAMGYHGGVFLVRSDGEMFFTTRSEKPDDFVLTLTWDELVRVFPPLKEFKPGMFGQGSEVPEGFSYEYLGMGNHLLVKEELYGRFKKIAEIIRARDGGNKIMYNLWLEAILALVRDEEVK